MKLLLLSALAAITFSFTVGPSSPPPPPSGCSAVTPPSGWTCIFDWTATFDNQTVGQSLDWQTLTAVFNDPSINAWVNKNYVYSNNTPCETWNGSTDTSGMACSLAPTIAGQIVSDGQSGNGLQVLADNGLCGYAINGFGVPSFGVNFSPSYNVIHVAWDEMWRPGFDLHSEGKIGILTTFKDPSLPIWYGPQNMFYNSNGSTTSFVPIMLNMGDYSTSNPRGAVVEAQVSPPTNWNLGEWYHIEVEIALGPNGYYKAWVNGVQYNNYPPNPGNLNGGGGESISGGPSATDAITTSNPSPLATGAGLRGFGIQPHFGGQPDHTTWAIGSGDCMRTNSYIVYDNIHITAYNR